MWGDRVLKCPWIPSNHYPPQSLVPPDNGYSRSLPFLSLHSLSRKRTRVDALCPQPTPQLGFPSLLWNGLILMTSPTPKR